MRCLFCLKRDVSILTPVYLTSEDAIEINKKFERQSRKIMKQIGLTYLSILQTRDIYLINIDVVGKR